MPEQEGKRLRPTGRTPGDPGIWAGVCNVCGHNTPMPGRNVCVKCYEARGRRFQKRYYERKAAGLCVNCGKPNVDGKARCPECRKKYEDYRRGYNMRTLKENVLSVTKNDRKDER